MEVLNKIQTAYERTYTTDGKPRRYGGLTLMPSEHQDIGRAAAWDGFHKYLVWADTKDLRRTYMSEQQREAAKEALQIIILKSIIDVVQVRDGDDVDVESIMPFARKTAKELFDCS